MTHKLKRGVFVAAGVALLLVFLSIIPQTKYLIPSVFIKKSATFLVVDNYGQAVPDATITVGSIQKTTDVNGQITMSQVAVGNHIATTTATFYDSKITNFKQPLFRRPAQTKIVLQPIGEVTKITVKNRLSGRAVIGARVVASQGGSGVTNYLGVAVVAMPKGTKNATATITSQDIVTFVATINSAQSSTDNLVYVTPSGRIAYLQKNSAKIQVVSSNIDGTEPVVLLDGTGNEDPTDTQLLPSPNQKFVALKARRESSAALYILDTVSAKLVNIENSGQSYIPIGWHGDTFVYLVYSKQPIWQPGTYKLKAFDTNSMQIISIDESRAEGQSTLDYASEVFENVYIMPEGIVYAKKWQASYYYGARLANKQMTITISDKSGNKKDISNWQAGFNAFIKTRQIGPAKLGIFVELDGVIRSYYNYNNKQVKPDQNVTENTFKNPVQDIYISSPNNLYSAWQTYDAKNYVGTLDGRLATQLLLPTTFRIIGWYNNDYLLLLDTASNVLRIADRNTVQNGSGTFSIGPIHIPNMTYTQNGYGR